MCELYASANHRDAQVIPRPKPMTAPLNTAPHRTSEGARPSTGLAVGGGYSTTGLLAVLARMILTSLVRLGVLYPPAAFRHLPRRKKNVYLVPRESDAHHLRLKGSWVTTIVL